MVVLVPDWFHRVTVVRHAPLGSLDRHAAELSAALGALRRIDLALGAFFVRGAPTEAGPCDPARELVRLLGRSTIYWAQRGPDDPSHALRLYNAVRGDPYAGLSTSFVLEGEEPHVSPGVAVEVLLGRFIEAAPDRTPAEALRAVLDALVRALQPDFAFVEQAGTTDPAPERPDKPVVRWLTYLSRAFQPVTALKPPNTSYALDDLGTAYLATDALASASEIPQKQALGQLQLALYAAVPDPAARPPEPPPKPAEPPPPVVTPAIPSFLQRGPAPAPPVPPAPASAPSVPPAAPSAPQAGARRRQNSGTADLSNVAPAAPAPALPFAGPSERPPAPRPARANAQNARTADLEAALAEAKGGRDALPFAKAPQEHPRAPAVQAPPLTLEQYASLHAELHVYADRAGEIMARHGVTGRAAMEALREAYRARFEKDPGMLQSFQKLELQYRDWFFRSKWRDT